MELGECWWRPVLIMIVRARRAHVVSPSLALTSPHCEPEAVTSSVQPVRLTVMPGISLLWRHHSPVPSWSSLIIPDILERRNSQDVRGWCLLQTGPDHSPVWCDFHPLHGRCVCPVSPPTPSHGRDCVWSTSRSIKAINISVRGKDEDGDSLLLSWGLQIRRYQQQYYVHRTCN